MINKKILIFLSVLILNSGVVLSAPNQPAFDEGKFKNSQMEQGLSVNQKEFDTDAFAKKYKKVTKEGIVMQAMEMMNTVNIGMYSYNALMGNNLTEKPFKIEFKNLSEIREEYASFDALGWKKKNRLYIYINEKHRNAPAEAIAALLAHEAIHQDEFASLNEETYAWTLEAAVWMKLSERNSNAEKSFSSLVQREQMLEKLFVKGDYTNRYILFS